LQSAASTLHIRNKKDILQRKALFSLPPIKPFELNHLAVESPHKCIVQANASFVNTNSNNLNSNTNN
jgi:hypothetical protein